MEGEYLASLAVVRAERAARDEAQDAWKKSLQRVAHAQALLWSRTPLAVRQGLLAEIDAESEAQK